MTADEFRQIALAFPETEEQAHMQHPDFRVDGKIFATLSSDEARAMVKLTPDQQDAFVAGASDVFEPVSGGWGERGATWIDLHLANLEQVRSAIVAAWRNNAPRRVLREWEAQGGAPAQAT
jgi:hypothetical protein